MYGNPAFDCDGAQIRACCRQLATVVTITGEIGIANLDRITEYARRFILNEKPFVLDLSAVNSFSAQCISLLHTIDEGCHRAAVEWYLVGNDPVGRALSGWSDGVVFPTAGSVPDALHHFADSIDERRRLLPLLTKKTA